MLFCMVQPSVDVVYIHRYAGLNSPCKWFTVIGIFKLEAGVPEERFERIFPERVKDGKTRRAEEGGSPGEGKDQDAEENRSTHA